MRQTARPGAAVKNDAMQPKDYPRRMLVAVTGLSPQVVTETLYALAVKPKQAAFVPTGIRLITTQEGAERARLELLHPARGWFHRLRKDYDLPPIAFGPEDIHVLADDSGQPLDDIRSETDNTRAADAITEALRALTADEGTALHVSIAGGRKTMGFYMGYALSLYGRAQDRLSHVLVNAPYESHKEFFYPTPKSRVIHTGNGRPYDTHDAIVTLADIPFVRLREGLNENLLQGAATFSAAVRDAQRALPPLTLVLNTETCEVSAGGETFRLQPAHFALYWLHAKRAHAERPGIHWSEDGMRDDLLGYYGRLVGEFSAEYERAETAYGRGLVGENVNPTKAHIKKELVQRLGTRRAEPYQIVRLEQISGTPYSRFGLALPPDAIRIIGGRNAATLPNRKTGGA